MANNIEEKRCMLCNKPYNYKYDMFGRGCLDNLYELLKVSKPPKVIWNKELYLCTMIAWKNHKFFLSKNKKYTLTQKYIALKYLDTMNYESLNDIKEKISKDISNIKFWSKNIIELISFKLNDIYQLFNYSQRFDEMIKEIKNIDFEKLDKEVAEKFIKDLSFIFDETKMSNPVSYAVFYAMQYAFWQVVVAGGILAKMNLSAKLLLHSLAPFEQEPEDLIIEDKETIKLITESDEVKNKLNQLIQRYGQGKRKFVIDEGASDEDILIRFETGDLLFALHDASILVKAQKDNENKWNFEIEIIDEYDFTDFKNLKEYADSNNNKFRDIFSTLLNNFGVVSSEYGVIKTYNLKIKFKTKEGEF